MELTTIGTINLMPTTKKQAEAFAEIVLTQLEQGETDSVSLAKKLKYIKKAIELIENGKGSLVGLKDHALNHVWASEASYKADGVFIKHTTKYDYSNCCDFEWDYYESKIREFRELQKEREEKLKIVNGSETIEYTNPMTGEIYMNKVFAPVKKYTEYLSFNE